MDNRGLSPEKLKELRQQRRAEKNQAKRQLEREKKRKKQGLNADKEREKAILELKAINNEKPTLSIKNQKNKDKTASRGKGSTGMSQSNRKWEQKRKERYNQRVWRGWRESDGQRSPIIKYNIKDLEEKQ